MATSRADKPAQGEWPSAPSITAAPGGVIIGTGFLPDHNVVVKITRREDDISDYLVYTTDRNGHLHADLPSSALGGTPSIAATDYRPDPGGMCGRLWSNTCTLSALGG